jgi:hypothetical protein
VRRVIACLAALGLAVAILPASVLADTYGGGEPPAAGSVGGMTVQVVSVRLIANVVVEAEVSVVCQPKPSGEGIYSWWNGPFLVLWAQQANKRSLAYGQTYASFSGDATCDGTAHTFKLQTSANPSGVAFKLGTAAIAVAGDASYSDPTCCSTVLASASTGWVPVKLKKK